MDVQQSINNVRRLYEEAYNNGNLNICDSICVSNLKFNDLSTAHVQIGITPFKEAEKEYHQAFPNKKVTIEDIFVSSDKVIVRWSCHGRHEGQFHDLKATHRNINISGISIYRFTNGKISEIWQAWDHLHLFEQLGIIHASHVLH